MFRGFLWILTLLHIASGFLKGTTNLMSRTRIRTTLEVGLSDLTVTLTNLKFSAKRIESCIKETQIAGWDETSDILLFAADYVDKPENLSDILQKDFLFSAVNAHMIRRAILLMLSETKKAMKDSSSTSTVSKMNFTSTTTSAKFQKVSLRKSSLKIPPEERFYGLRESLSMRSQLQKELDEFFVFMTEPNLRSQEIPIRASTARVLDA